MTAPRAVQLPAMWGEGFRIVEDRSRALVRIDSPEGFSGVVGMEVVAAIGAQVVIALAWRLHLMDDAWRRQVVPDRDF